MNKPKTKVNGDNRKVILFTIILTSVLLGLFVIVNISSNVKKANREFFSPESNNIIESPDASGFIRLDPSMTEEDFRKEVGPYWKTIPQENEINGYIVEFKEPTIVEKRLQSRSASGKSGVYENDAEDYRDSIKEKIMDLLGKSDLTAMNSLSKQGVKSTNRNSLNVLAEYENIFNGIALDITQSEAELIKNNIAEVKEVYPNYKVFALLDQSVPVIKADIARSAYGVDGRGVTIAVIDTGIDSSHESLDDLDDNSSTNDPKIIGWKDYVNFRPGAYDDMGHGTHCAGIAAGTGGSTDYVGVAPGANLVGVKVLNEHGSGWFSDVIAGIEWVVQNKDRYNISIISMSLGANVNSDGTTPVEIAADLAVQYGVNFVVAAGNAGAWGANTVGIPACANNVITVGAVNNNRVIAYFSSRGPTADGRIKPEVTAPGVNVYSSVPQGDCELCDSSGYMSLSGTSMATPHVAGVVALLLQQNPDLSPSEVKQLLMDTAVDKGNSGPDNDYGWGVVNTIDAFIDMNPPQHEISLDEIMVNSWTKLGEPLEINASLTNKGLNDESVTYRFYIDNVEVQNGSISLDSLEASEVKYSWTPSQEGNHIIKVKIDPLAEEFIDENNEQEKNITVIDVLGTIKAVVVDSWGNYYTTYNILDELDNDWYLYGYYVIEVDLTSLAKDGITYNDIAATNADVLILSDAWDQGTGVTGKNMEFTDDEINAIKQYVQEGHGIIGTSGTLSTDYVENNMKLAPLFGLDQNSEASWSYIFDREFDILVEDDILTKDIDDPYSAGYHATVAFLEINESVPVTLVAESEGSSSYQSAFVSAFKMAKGASVYFTHMPEIVYSNEEDRQFFYNALVWSKENSAEQQHDIAVYGIKTNLSLFLLDNPIEINATVKNVGLNNENNIIIKLLVDGVEDSRKTISSLAAGNEITVSFSLVPSETGEKEIVIEAQQVSGENVLLNNNVGDTINVAGAHFTGKYYDSGIDLNDDQMFDYLKLSAEVEVNEDSYYSMALCLYTQFGVEIDCETEYYDLEEGLNNISVLISGIGIRNLGLNGPYKVKELKLRDDNWDIIDEREEAFNTSYYGWEDFQEASDIRVNVNYESRVVVNQNFTITADVENIGNAIATNATASLYFYDEYYNGSEWIDNLTLVETKDLGDINVSSEKEVLFTVGGLNEGYYGMILIVNATNDFNPDNNELYIWFEVLEDAPDIYGYVMSDDMNLIVNQSNEIEVYVRNQGFRTAQQTVISLYESKDDEEDYRLIDEMNIGSLENDNSEYAYFEWTPNETGVYDLIVNLSCINDSNLDNNDYSTEIKVTEQGPDIYFWWSFIGNLEIGTESEIYWSLHNSGSDTAYNLKAKMYVFDDSKEYFWINTNVSTTVSFDGASYNITPSYLGSDNGLVQIAYPGFSDEFYVFENKVIGLPNGVFVHTEYISSQNYGLNIGYAQVISNNLSGTLNSQSYRQYTTYFTPEEAGNFLFVGFINSSSEVYPEDNYQASYYSVNTECDDDNDCESQEYCIYGECRTEANYSVFERILFEPNGDNKIKVEAPLKNYDISLDILADTDNNGEFDYVGGSATKKLVTNTCATFTVDMDTDEYFLITKINVSEGETEVLQLTNVNDIDGVTVKDFQGDVVADSKKTGSSFDSAGMTVIVVNYSQSGNNATFYISDSACNSGYIVTKEGLLLELPSVYDLDEIPIYVAVKEEDELGDIGLGNKVDLGLGFNSYNDSSISDIQEAYLDYGFHQRGSSNIFFSYADSNIGTKLIWDKSSDQYKLEIQYPYESFGCGNNIAEPDEVCDGSDLDNNSCSSFGYDTGSLACCSECDMFDLSGCANTTRTCTDYDGETGYYTYSNATYTVSYSYGPNCNNQQQSGSMGLGKILDSCNQSFVVEAICYLNNTAGKISYACPYGCQNGACINISDNDCDGINDEWESYYGFSSSNSSVPSSLVNTDGDSLSDYQEGVAGTNPNLADSFGIISQTISGNNMALRIKTFQKNNYSIQGKIGMSGSWENVTFFYGAVNQNYTDINISLNLGYSYFQAKSYSLHVCSVQQNVTLSCIDSDGGLNYYVKGNATGWSPLINEIYTEVDSCGLDQNGNMTLVFEAGCNGSNVGLYTTNCPLGCFDGKCNFGCGDGIKNLNESCDGADFGSLSCSSYGFNAGSLSCNLNCSVNSTACYTATTNSGSGSSGGSGGGSSGSRATTFTLGDLTTQIPVTSGKGDTITFYVKGSQHKIEITDISQSSVDLTISSKITRLTLNSGETKEVDVDGDGTKDIRISLEKISSKKAYLTVDTIKQTVIVQAICNNNGICEAGEGYNNCQNDCSAEDVIVKPAGEQPRFIEQVICNYNKICDKQETPNTCPSDCKRIGSDWLILAIVAIFAMILIILWVVIERHAKQMPRVSGKIRQEVIALLKMRKNLSEIRSYLLFKKYPEEEVKSALIYANNFNTLRIYVQKCIGYGYTKKEIYLVLKNARWPKELSRDVVESEVNG